MTLWSGDVIQNTLAYKDAKRAPCSLAADPSPPLTGHLRALSYLPLLADWASKDPPHTLMVHLALTQPRPCLSSDIPPGSLTQYPLPANVLLSQTFLPLSSGD